MSDRRGEPRADDPGDRTTARIDAVADDILPALVARLRASRLGELEVRADGWRIRLRRAAPRPDPPPAAASASLGRSREADDASRLQGSVARSPAVGYFSSGADLVVGRSVQAGDSLGSVDVLGIRQDVAAPTDGVISRVLVEDDQAVEFGQVLAHIEPLGTDPVADEIEVAGESQTSPDGAAPAGAARHDPAPVAG